MNKNNYKHFLALLCTAVIWGVNYVAQTVGGEVGTFTFNTICSVFAFASLMVYAGIKHIRIDRRSVVPGLLIGIILLLAMTFQQFGVVNSTVGKSGFITALYIVIVPILGIAIGQRLTWNVTCAVALSVIGMTLLCLNEDFSLQMGDLLLLVCAFFYAVQILMIDRYCKDSDPVVMSAFQFLVVGIVSAVLMFIFEKPQVSEIQNNMVSLLFAGVVGNGIAYALQMYGQNRVNPAACSLILSLESPISVIAGILILGQIPSLREGIGCALMFAAIFIVQQNPSKKEKENDA